MTKNLKKIVRKSGGNPNPIMTKEVVAEIAKTVLQKRLSKNSLLHKYIIILDNGDDFADGNMLDYSNRE